MHGLEKLPEKPKEVSGDCFDIKIFHRSFIYCSKAYATVIEEYFIKVIAAVNVAQYAVSINIKL